MVPLGCPQCCCPVVCDQHLLNPWEPDEARSGDGARYQTRGSCPRPAYPLWTALSVAAPPRPRPRGQTEPVASVCPWPLLRVH